MITIKGVRENLSRVVYMVRKMRGIPKGKIIRHTCDNPMCINPKHLVVGTHKDNAHDRVKRGRSATGARAGARKLTVEQVREVLRDKSLSNAAMAWKMGVGKTTIQHIRERNTWKEVVI